MKNSFAALAVAAQLAVTFAASAGEPTALDLVREGNRYVGESFKDKVVLIRSEKSVATLTPQTWLVNYRNEFTSLKGLEVKFIGGKMADIDNSSKGGRPFDLSKLKIDSDKALNVVTNEPILKNLTLRATQMTLEPAGENAVPAWRIQVWAAKLKSPSDSVSVGEVWVSAEDGAVLKNNLKIARVD